MHKNNNSSKEYIFFYSVENSNHVHPHNRLLTAEDIHRKAFSV